MLHLLKKSYSCKNEEFCNRSIKIEKEVVVSSMLLSLSVSVWDLLGNLYRMRCLLLFKLAIFLILFFPGSDLHYSPWSSTSFGNLLSWELICFG